MKFTTILKNVILEQSRMEVLADKLTKPQGEKKKIIMAPEELFALVVADPESKIVDGVDIDNFDGDFNKVKKVGPYTQWLIKQYLSIVPSVNGEVIPKEDEKEYKPSSSLASVPLMLSQPPICLWTRFQRTTILQT